MSRPVSDLCKLLPLVLLGCGGKSSDVQLTGSVRGLAADADGLVIALERDQKSSIEYLPKTGPRVTIKNGAWSIMAVTLEADRIYWVDLRHVRSARRGETTFDEVTPPSEHAIDDMAIVGPDLYWTADRAVWKTPKSLDGARTVEKVWAPTTCRPDELAATGAGLVVACSVMKAHDDFDTELWQLGGTAPIAKTPGVVLALVSDGTHVVWTAQHDKQLATYELGASAAIPLPQVTGAVLAVSGTSIVWREQAGTHRTDATGTTRIAEYATEATIAGDRVILSHPGKRDRATIKRLPLR
jgi:hypothetical protein